MKRRSPLFFSFVLLCCSATFAQQPAQSEGPKKQGTPAAGTETQQKNIQAYIDLLRGNVRQQKSEVMGAMMQLDADEAAKFWPIYSEYDKELSKLNELRVANIQDYANSYDNMNDAKADELMQRALNYRRQRADLLARYYGRVKASLGAIQGARFLQIENQLLELIDLQIESSLPIASQTNSKKGE